VARSNASKGSMNHFLIRTYSSRCFRRRSHHDSNQCRKILLTERRHVVLVLAVVNGDKVMRQLVCNREEPVDESFISHRNGLFPLPPLDSRSFTFIMTKRDVVSPVEEEGPSSIERNRGSFLIIHDMDGLLFQSKHILRKGHQ